MPAAGDGTSAFAAFRIVLDYTDSELDASMQQVWARHLRLARPPWGLWTIILGSVIALTGTFLAQALGATPPRNATILFIVLAGYWLGFWAEGARAAWAWRRIRQVLRDDQRRAFHGAGLLVSSRGLAVRSRNSRVFHAWRAIVEVEITAGLIMLFTATGDAVAIPERLLTPAQWQQVLAFADPPCPYE